MAFLPVYLHQPTEQDVVWFVRYYTNVTIRHFWNYISIVIFFANKCCLYEWKIFKIYVQCLQLTFIRIY